MMGELVLGTERELTNTGVLTVGTHNEVNLAGSTPFEFDTDPPVVLSRHGPHRVAEHDLDIVGHRTKQDAYQVVPHDLNLAITARLVQGSQCHVVGAPAVGTHRRQRQNLRSCVADRGVEPHPFDHLQRATADVDRVPADPQSGVRSTSIGRWPRRSSQ